MNLDGNMATKPRAKFAGKAKLPMAMSKPVIRKRDGTNWENKADLQDFVDEQYAPPTSDTYLLAVCACGVEFSYAEKTDIPDADVNCTCGRPILKYGN